MLVVGPAAGAEAFAGGVPGVSWQADHAGREGGDVYEAGPYGFALHCQAVPMLEQELSRRLARERNTYRKEHQRWKARGRMNRPECERSVDWGRVNRLPRNG